MSPLWQLLSTVLLVGGGIVVQVLINKSNAQGRRATQQVEEKRVELDGKKVDLEVLTESIVNLREDLAEERRRADAAEQRAGQAERRAVAAERRARESEKSSSRATRLLNERLAEAEHRVEVLEQILAENDIAAPDHTG